MSSRETKKSELDLYIINRVKALRVERNISQAILAAKLDVSDAFIGQIENPKIRSKYNLAHLNKLAVIFDCTLWDLIPEKPIL